MHNNEITDRTCSIYRAHGYDNGEVCSAMNICRNCNPGEACFVPDQYLTYQVDEFDTIKGEDNMLQEIYQRGPIACDIAVPQALDDYTGGLYCDDTHDHNTVHVVSVVGYGVEDGTKYWLVRNSWGTHWGENGFFKVCRGTNNINMRATATGRHQLTLGLTRHGIRLLTLRRLTLTTIIPSIPSHRYNIVKMLEPLSSQATICSATPTVDAVSRRLPSQTVK